MTSSQISLQISQDLLKFFLLRLVFQWDRFGPGTIQRLGENSINFIIKRRSIEDNITQVQYKDWAKTWPIWSSQEDLSIITSHMTSAKDNLFQFSLCGERQMFLLSWIKIASACKSRLRSVFTFRNLCTDPTPRIRLFVHTWVHS